METNKNENQLVKINLLLHRIVGRWQSSLMTFGINKGYFITIGFTIFSLLKIYIDGGFDSVELKLQSIGPISATILAGGYTVFNNIILYINLAFDYQIVYEKNYKNKVIKSLELSNRMSDSGYKIDKFNNGKSTEYYIMSSRINKILMENSLDYKILSRKFQIVDEIKNFIPTIMNNNFESNRIIFNGKLLRMSTELYLDTEMVNVQKVKYFDYLCTNEISFKIIKSCFSINDMFLGQKLIMDKHGIIYDNEISPCANIIGASTLVITKDNHLIIGKQGEFSKSNPGRYAPSGSGSVDYSDSNSSQNFNETIIKAMNREFCEECNYSLIKSHYTMKTTLVGYTKLIGRGLKPDFFGISYLNENIADVKNGIKRLEQGLTEGFISLKIDNYNDVSDVLNQFCIKHTTDKTLSIQLYLINEILKNTNMFELKKKIEIL